MRKLAGYVLIITGSVLVLISILGLVKAFDVFYEADSGSRNYTYTLGSIVFPLLMTVLGRWVFRTGVSLKNQKK